MNEIAIQIGILSMKPIHVLGTQGRNYDMYLGLGMRYESEI